MILSQIKTLLREQGVLSATQISQQTGYDKPVVEQALRTLREKDVVISKELESPCKGCGSSCVSLSCSEDSIYYCLK